MRLFGSIKELVSAVFRINSKQITLQPNQEAGFSYGADRTVSLPKRDADDVLVSRDSTDILTNKTIDIDSGNTVSNIANTNIKTGAAIDRTKLASGTASHVIINDGSGVLSSESKLAISRGGTNATTASAAFDNLAPTTTRGDIIRRGLTSNERLAIGTAGTVLLTGDGVDINWSKIADANIATGAAISDTKLATISTAGKVSNSATTATNSNTPSAIVARDASGNFSAGTITANLTGNASGTASNVTGTVAIGNGGTGKTTQQEALTALSGTQVSGQYLRSNGTNTLLSAIQDADLPSSMASKTLTSSAISSAPATVVGTGALKLPTGNSSTDRPTGTAAQLKGMVRYNDTDDVFEGYNELSGWSSIGGGGTTDRVTQASHGFVVGDTLYLNGSTYTKAIATSATAAEVVGVVSRVIDSSTFEITLSGEVSGLSGLITGEVYFLSEVTAGALTTTEPSVIGQVSVPVGVASSASTLYVAPKRGIVVGGSNARTEINLLNTTSAQMIYTAPSGLEAGELAGWVYIDAGTDYRFYLTAQFSKNGAGTDWNISYQTSGDTPPTGFSVSMTSPTAPSPNQIQVTMNPVPASFVSGKVNYSINGPAVGATAFPLAINGSQVTEASNLSPGVVNTTTQTFGGDKTFIGNIKLGNNQDITPDANWSGQLTIDGVGYNGGISLDATGMWVGHNATGRSLIFSTNETNQGSVSGTGVWTIGASGSTSTHAVNGTLDISGKAIVQNGSTTVPGLAFQSDSTTGVARSTASRLDFIVGGVNVGYFSGTTLNIPTASGNLTVGGTTTTAGLVLTGMSTNGTAPGATQTYLRLSVNGTIYKIALLGNT